MSNSSPPATRPPLRSLEIAVAVAQSGSLTGAAEHLGLTHGAVSRQIKTLEQSLGMRLFDRHGRGVSATPEGERYLRAIQRSLDAIDSVSERWYQRRGRHVVRIGCTPTFAYLWLLRRIPALQSGDPALRIEVLAEAGYADIERGEVDCAIRYTRPETAPDGARLFLSETLCPVASPEIAARIGENPDPEAILAEPLMHDTDASKWRAWAREAAGRSFRPSPRDRRFESYPLTLEAARAGLGIALGQEPVASELVADRGLVRLCPQPVPSPLNYYLIQRPGPPSDGLRILLDRLMAEVWI